MRTGLVVVLIAALGCTKSGPGQVDNPAPVTPSQPEIASGVKPEVRPEVKPEVKPETRPDPQPTGGVITVQMTAATLADDCGGGPIAPPVTKVKAKRAARERRSLKADRACEQSSMQLAISSPSGAGAADLTVRSVELLLASGASIGKLEARAPSRWSDAEGYTPWDQKITPAQELSVSYALTQPDWSKVSDRWNQTYTVKAVVTIGGADQTVEHNVEVDAPTSLPPNVKT